MLGTPSAEGLQRLRDHRTDISRRAEGMLLSIRSGRGADATLNAREEREFRGYQESLGTLDAQIADYERDLQRSQLPAHLAHLGGGDSRRRPGAGRINCRPGSQVMPIDFGLEQLRSAHEKLMRGESALLESRANNTALPLPSELYSSPIFPLHEGRIADYLPAYAAETNNVEYVRVDSVSGEATVVAEGAAKPEITLNVTRQTAVCIKIAAHLGLTQESIADFDAFTSSATTELQRLVIDKENAFLLAWLNVAGILTHPATNTPTFDDIEEAIAELRSGPSLATADLLVVSPTTWSSIRREKDGMERYYVAPDPSVGEVNTVWGVNVVSTTAVPDGEGWLLDTTKAGRMIVREPMTLRVGFSGDDFVRNVVRYISEERCFYAVERPSAVLKLTGLAPETAKSTKAKASSSS
jgi:HK97 family phage major capsid protein